MKECLRSKRIDYGPRIAPIRGEVLYAGDEDVLELSARHGFELVQHCRREIKWQTRNGQTAFRRLHIGAATDHWPFSTEACLPVCVHFAQCLVLRNPAAILAPFQSAPKQPCVLPAHIVLVATPRPSLADNLHDLLFLLSIQC
jgi:hypothetical protein